MVNTLIVEDNHYFRQSFRKILNERFPEMDIVEAGNAREAIDICARGCQEMVFLDINLPLGNGLDVCRTIRNDHPGTVIFILTNYDLPEYRQAAYRHGANHFIPKDARQEEVFSLVETEMQKKRGSA
jgi:DNA-binding NarL/FixJ family response regulator